MEKILKKIEEIHEECEVYDEDDRKERNDKINLFLKNFPIPVSKDDLIEFIVGMDSKRRNEGDDDLQKVYVLKAQTIFPNDDQLDECIKRTSKRFFNLSNDVKGFLYLFLPVLFLMMIGGVVELYEDFGKYMERSEIEKEKGKIEMQFTELTTAIDQLPIPNSSNLQECKIKVQRIVWEPISLSYENEKLQKNSIKSFITKKNAYIKIVNGLSGKDKIDLDRPSNYGMDTYEDREMGLAREKDE